MTLKQFFVGRAIGFTILILGFLIVSGFFMLNDYIYEQKQAPKDQVVVPKEIVGENLEGEADPSRMTLGMNAWTWVADIYADGKRINRSDSKPFKLSLGDDGRFTASGDCNAISGTYTTDDKKNISFSQIVSTKMYCEGSKENDFTFMLGDTAAYHFTSRGELILQLKFDNGLAVFR
ncbi:META domain-containing protein [Patescibacteria group bacterium]|nr:META domain-containing protein [Patescibacteria group bacterium]